MVCCLVAVLPPPDEHREHEPLALHPSQGLHGQSPGQWAAAAGQQHLPGHRRDPARARTAGHSRYTGFGV